MKGIHSKEIFLVVYVRGVGLSGCSGGSSPLPQGPDISEEYDMLLEAEYFQGAHVGISGETPEVVYAFRAVLDHPDGDDCFKELIRDARIPGQIYGLAGVDFTDPAMVNELAQAYRNDSRRLETVLGCILGE